MTEAPLKVVALLPIFDEALLSRTFAGRSAITCTVDRLARCREIDGVALLHDDTLPPHAAARLAVMADAGGALPVHVLRTDAPLADAARPARLAARRFCPVAWRGGIGSLTCYDESLAPAAMAEALNGLDASAALIAGADWPVIDLALCDAVAARHRQDPQRLPLVFTQAAVGFAPCLLHHDLLAALARAAANAHPGAATIGALLEFSPTNPMPDPIAKDACVQIDPVIRDVAVAGPGIRAVADDGPGHRLLEGLARELDLPAADAATMARDLNHAAQITDPPGPQHVTLELTPRRNPTGPVVPQHHVTLDRPDMPTAAAIERVQQIAKTSATLTLGGLGDPLLHDAWPAIAAAARDAGVTAIHLETDLLAPPAVIDQLVESDLIDVVSVRLNADSRGTYHQLMGVDRFDEVVANVQRLLQRRRGADATGRRRRGLPWIVPRLVKVAENLHEIEPFFDRWMHHGDHAVIDGPTTGNGRMPDLSLVDMAPPTRRPCRQLAQRVTVLADNQPALCDQDWLGEAGPTTSPITLDEAWSAAAAIRQLHRDNQTHQQPPCHACTQWHRP